MTLVNEIMAVAKQENVELSLMVAMEKRREAEDEIKEAFKGLMEAPIEEIIGLIVPLVTAPIQKPEYFGELFQGQQLQAHCTLLSRYGLSSLADAVRIASAVFNPGVNLNLVFTLKADVNSPAGYSVNNFGGIYDPDTLVVPEGIEKTAFHQAMFSSPLEKVTYVNNFSDTLRYTKDTEGFENILLSNLMITWMLTHAAVGAYTGVTPLERRASLRNPLVAPYNPEVYGQLYSIQLQATTPPEWFELFEADELNLVEGFSNLIKQNLAKLNIQ